MKNDPPAEVKLKPDALPDSAVQARANLDKLREKDAKTVKDAERFFFLQ